MKKFNQHPDSTKSADDAGTLHSLCHVAIMANRLAKQLTGINRALAYQIKSEALSTLIVSGVAIPNGFHPDNIVGLDVLYTRLHCPCSSLSKKAQILVDLGRPSVPRTAPLVDLLNPSEVESLTSVLRSHAA